MIEIFGLDNTRAILYMRGDFSITHEMGEEIQ
jgi:hypothetical protein